ncbi:hypothetical protein TTHERM_00254520 (macronuclear) [Tetrahymena thermophila SB210]|uniref:Uncharacterized protein n=1 Tax=Tetrahymena thermophila (strain SB210) TaxID=312017 RepID=Q23QM8_TETTS|nr:hypothetical protein TTHERM_00254520 [Tetrahymena thermophila SB210]EAR98860.1 hypothetical protein TTHERM_00254520 [Tetrahymena thermophila SB210]|eukprot:XP_001019105.1 hypothetical protein TTHERM_00254520 [Tetrahymena thermophila SB210]
MNQVNFQDNQGGFNIANCLLHPESKVSVVFLDDTLQYQVGCLNCVINNELQVSKFVSIDSILNDKSFIKNWPPFQDKNLKQLNDFICKFGSSGEFNEIELVRNYFQELKKEINDFIFKIEKKVISDISNLDVEKHNLIQKIKEMSKFEQFKETIINNKDDFKVLNSSVKSFLVSYFVRLKESENTLINMSNSFFEKIKTKKDYFESQKTIISNIILNEKFYDISQLLSKISSEISNQVQNEIHLPIQVVATQKQGQFNSIQYQSYTHILATQRHQFYVDQVLNHEKKYEITIKNVETREEFKPLTITLGLAIGYNTNTIIQDFVNQRDYKQYGIRSFKEIKVQIWLKNKVFRFKIDGKQLYEFEDWQTYKPFENYFFTLFNIYNSNIYLQDFKEVKDFQIW